MDLIIINFNLIIPCVLFYLQTCETAIQLHEVGAVTLRETTIKRLAPKHAMAGVKDAHFEVISYPMAGVTQNRFCQLHQASFIKTNAPVYLFANGKSRHNNKYK